MASATRSPVSSRALPALLAALVALLLLAPGGPAAAHDSLTGSEPADGETVEQAPEELVLTFSGQVASVGALVEVTGPDGEQVAEGDPQVEGTDVTQGLAHDLAAGPYEVAWRVTSQDGHPISGTFGFEVAQGAEAEGPGQEDGAPSDEATEDAAGEATDDADDATSDEATAEETTPAPTAAEETAEGDDASITAGPDAAAEPSGLPVWAWVLVALAALGLLGLLARTWTRRQE